MRKELKFIFLLFLLSILSVNVYAAKRYWAANANANWNVSGNWSATSGGAGGVSVPGSNDTVYFDSTANFQCTIDATVNIKRLEILATFTNTIIQGANAITIGTSGAVLSGGTFTGGSSNITVTGAFTLSGTAFTSTSATLILTSTFTNTSGSFTHNSGLVYFNPAGAKTYTGTTTFYRVQFFPTANASTLTFASGTTFTTTDLTVSGTFQTTFAGGTINVTGDITITNTYPTSSNTTLITITGTGSQHIYGQSGGSGFHLPDLTINKSGTLYLHNSVLVSGDFTYTAGTIDAGTSTVVFAYLLSISGTFALNNVTFNGPQNYTYTLTSASLTVKGTLSVNYTNGAGYVRLLGGTIHAEGNITVANTTNSNPLFGGGTTVIAIDGTGNQTLTGSNTEDAGYLPAITINKTSGTLSLVNKISTNANWTWTAGTVSAGTSTVYIYGSRTITGSHTLHHLTFDGTSAVTNTIASGTILTLTGTLTTNGSGAVTLNTGTIYAQGNITVTNTSASSGGSASIIINGGANQLFTGNGTAGQGKLPKITINKTGGTLYLNSVISVFGDWIYSAGTVAASYYSMGTFVTSTVVLYGTSNLNGTGGGSAMSFYNLTIGGNTRTLTGNIDVNNNLAISSGATFSAGSNSINCGGNWANSNGTWTYGTSTVVFDGSTYRNIARTSGGSAATETFYNLSFNRSGASQTLGSPATVNNVLTLTAGHVKSTTANYLTLIDNATLVGGSNMAYVHGPVRKTGNDAFIFPLGDTTLADTTAYHPLGISAPAVNTDQFEATYFALAQTYGDSLVDSLGSISNCEYWALERKSGTSTVSVTGTWNSNSCNISDYQGLRLAQWNGTFWDDLGVSSIAVTDRQGTITSPVALSFPISRVPIVISRPRPTDPYAVLRRKLDGGYYQVNNGALFFRFDDEYNDADELLTFNVYSNMNNLITSNTSLPAIMQLLVYYGDNRYKLNTLNCHFTASGSLPTGFYILEVINEKNEHWFLRFQNNTNNITVSCPTQEQG